MLKRLPLSLIIVFIVLLFSFSVRAEERADNLDTKKLERFLKKISDKELKTQNDGWKGLEKLAGGPEAKNALLAYLQDERIKGIDALARAVAADKKFQEELGVLRERKKELIELRRAALKKLLDWNAPYINFDYSDEAKAIHAKLMEVKTFYLGIKEAVIPPKIFELMQRVKLLEKIIEKYGRLEPLNIKDDNVKDLLLIEITSDKIRDFPADESDRNFIRAGLKADEFNDRISAGKMTDEEILFMRRWNQTRGFFGLDKVYINLKLYAVCREHSEWLAKSGQWTHREEEMARRAGVKWEGEGGSALYRERTNTPNGAFMGNDHIACVLNGWTIQPLVSRFRSVFLHYYKRTNTPQAAIGVVSSKWTVMTFEKIKE